MLELYWHCLDMHERDEQSVRKNLAELSQLLKRKPVTVELGVVQLPSNLAKLVDIELRDPPLESKEPFREVIYAIRKKLPFSKWAPLVVYCKPSASIALAAQKQDENALWGYMCDYRLSAVYNLENKHTLWHEALHLFDVEDCHSGPRNPGPTCELPECIMQYKSKEGNVCSWPFLCQKNVKLIQACAEKQK